jgi:hypothetical protein
MNMTGNKKTVRAEDFSYLVIENGKPIAGFHTRKNARLFVDLLAQGTPPRKGEIATRLEILP